MENSNKYQNRTKEESQRMTAAAKKVIADVESFQGRLSDAEWQELIAKARKIAVDGLTGKLSCDEIEEQLSTLMDGARKTADARDGKRMILVEFVGTETRLVMEVPLDKVGEAKRIVQSYHTAPATFSDAPYGAAVTHRFGLDDEGFGELVHIEQKVTIEEVIGILAKSADFCSQHGIAGKDVEERKAAIRRDYSEQRLWDEWAYHNE